MIAIEQEKEKNLADYIYIGLLVLNGYLLYRLGDLNGTRIWQFILVCFSLLIAFIGMPMNEYRKKGVLHRRKLLVAIRIGIYLVFVVSGYLIVLSKSYNLKYTYYIGIVSIFMIILFFIFETPIIEYNSNKHIEIKKKIWYLIVGGLLSLLLVVLPAYFIVKIIRVPGKELELADVSMPAKIQIYRREADTTTNIAEQLKNKTSGSSVNQQGSFFTVTIENTGDIKKVVKELNAARTKSYDFLEKLNYEKMKSDHFPYYILNLNSLYMENQKKASSGRSKQIYIVVTSNKKAVIDSVNYQDKWLLGTLVHHDIYPIDFTEKTMNMIFKYIEKY